MNRQADEVETLVRTIHAMLESKPPGVQGVVLCDLLALYMVGWPSAMRESLLNEALQLVRQLIPLNDRLHDDGRGHPLSAMVLPLSRDIPS